jgi:hypothetical protein
MPRSTIASRAHAAIAAVFRPGVHRRYRLSLESLERRDCPAVVAVVGGGTIAEGGESQLLTIRLSAPATKAVKVGYQITGHSSIRAVDTADYRLTVGATGLAGPSGSIEFRPGETVKQVRVAAVDDAVREGTESLRFTLFRPVGCTINAASSGVDISVLDNDDYTAALVPQGPSRVNEGAGAPFVIELSKPATRAETFYVSTQDGTATTADYRPLRDMPVTILAGQQRSQPFSLNTVTDTNNTETDEYFLVTARARSADMPAIESVGVTIRGTGPAPITLAVVDGSVVEGNSGTKALTFTIRLSAPVLEPVVVQYATSNGTASAGSDYQAATGEMTFSRGQISKTVSIIVNGDEVVEEAETFRLTVSATLAGRPQTVTATGLIQDDDSAFQITVSYLTPMQPGWTAAVQRAVAKWQSIIVGDVPDIMHEGRLIDDFEIRVSFQTLSPTLLGYARSLAFRPGPGGLPYLGEMVMNSIYADRPGIYDTIVHELAHSLGFSPTMWSRLSLTGGTSGDPRFLGRQATQAFNEIFGRSDTGVPLYEQGSPGDGSYGAHWRDSVFGFEAMVHAGDPSITGAPVSRVTVAQFADIGYRVNYMAADPYSPPASGRAASRSANLAVAVSSALQQQKPRVSVRTAVFASLAS